MPALLPIVLSALLASDVVPRSLIDGGHWKRLRAAAEERLRASPRDAAAVYWLGRVSIAYGDSDGALALAERAVALEPQNSSYRYLLAASYGRKAQAAGIFSKVGLAGRFKKEAEAALALDPKSVEARDGLIQFHLQAPGLVGGDKAKARALAEEMARIDPVQGLLAQARIAQSEKRSADGEALLLRAVQADATSYEARLAAAAYYASDARKKYDLADEHARQALKLEPGRAGAYSLLAGLAARRERWAELDGLLSDAEKNAPDNLNPYYQAARILVAEGKDFARAERYLRKYLTQEPEGGMPSHAHAYWRLGLALEKQGRRPEAKSALETALRLKPDLEEAKRDLRRLK
jgi:tetratricopeptide (TPR) repeat protein